MFCRQLWQACMSARAQLGSFLVMPLDDSRFMGGSVVTQCRVRCVGMTGYITGATLSSSMGRAVPVTLPSLQQAVAAAKRSS